MHTDGVCVYIYIYSFSFSISISRGVVYVCVCVLQVNSFYNNTLNHIKLKRKTGHPGYVEIEL